MRLPSVSSPSIASRPPLVRRAACVVAVLIGGVAVGDAAAGRGTGRHPAGQAAASNQPVYWGSRELALPYRHTASFGHSTRPVLYVSTNAGSEWRVAAYADRDSTGFRFTAAADGEHRFAVRSDAGTGASSAGLQPELTVIVDTVRPTVLDAAAARSGDVVTLRVVVSDSVGIDPQGVQVLAQTPGATNWGMAPMQSAAPSADGHAADARRAEVVGQLRLTTPADELRLRILAEDKAGNRVEETATVMIRSSGAPTPHGGPYGGSNAPTAKRPPKDPFLVTSNRQRAAMTVAAPVAVAVTNPYVASRPITQPSRNGWGAVGTRDGTDKPTSQAWPSDAPKQAAPLAVNRAAAPTPFQSAAFARGSTMQTDGMTGQSNGITGQTDGMTGQADRIAAPPRVVGSPRFEFDYEVESAGKWGVSAVELWGTSDEGRSWRRFAIDSDLRSPIHVETPGEGDYGFRLLVTSVGGLTPPTPRPGDEPEARVRVDLRRPALAITGVSQGAGYFADQVTIAWTADDENATDRPIDLAYATRPEGPWTPIATGVENTGRYRWRLQRHIPRSVYVRVTARDAGGNVATAVTRTPLTIDMPSPAGTLQSVRSASR